MGVRWRSRRSARCGFRMVISEAEREDVVCRREVDRKQIMATHCYIPTRAHSSGYFLVSSSFVAHTGHNTLLIPTLSLSLVSDDRTTNIRAAHAAHAQYTAASLPREKPKTSKSKQPKVPPTNTRRRQCVSSHEHPLVSSSSVHTASAHCHLRLRLRCYHLLRHLLRRLAFHRRRFYS